MSPTEFDCIDCKMHITTYATPPIPGVCAECTFLRAIKDPEERAAMRRHLHHQQRQEE